MFTTLILTLYACDAVSILKERETIKYALEKEGLEIKDNRNIVEKTKSFVKDYLKYLIPGSFLYYDIASSRKETIENRINELKSRNLVVKIGEVQKESKKDNKVSESIKNLLKKEEVKKEEKVESKVESKVEQKIEQKPERKTTPVGFLSNDQLLRHYYKVYLESEKQIAKLQNVSGSENEIRKYTSIKNDAARKYNSIKRQIQLEKLKEERNIAASLSNENKNISLRK